MRGQPLRPRLPPTAPRLDLLLPGLCAPASGASEMPRAALLERLLARATSIRWPGADCTATVFALIAGRLDAPCDLPSAPYCLAADDPTWDRHGYWLHADPVHLRADRDRLRLYDARALRIEPAETQALVALLNAHLSSANLLLHAPQVERWYLRALAPPRLNAWPLPAVTGRELTDCLPSGADARTWNALMTEVQMLLHQAPANERRRAVGQPTINGIWIWGGGGFEMLRAAPDAPTRVIAAAPLARGLALAAGVAVEPPAADLGALLDRCHPRARLLIVGDQLNVSTSDPDAWRAGLETLESWLAPAAERLRDGRVRLRLGCGNGHAWELDQWRWRRFWRRARPLAARCFGLID